jgi:formate hydrogenlyase subunit 3/multisubunit Na+/H+ antiporter MnhD subunit
VHLAGLAPGLALDGLAAFVLLVLLPGVAGWLAVAPRPALPLAVSGASVLAVLAADAGTLGLALLAAGLGAAVVAGRGVAWAAGGAVAALSVALALAAGDGGFASARAHPAEGAALWLMVGLVLGAGAWLAVRAEWGQGREGGPAGSVLATLGLYLLVRLGLDVAGPVAGVWAGVLVLAGAAGVGLGGVAAVRAEALGGVAAAIGLVRSGLVMLGLGLAVAARAGDDGPAAAMALGAALVLLAVLGWAQALWWLVAHGLVGGAGTETLGRLGGLGRRMRITLVGALAAGWAVALLPPGGGFAGLWLMLRAAVTLPRGGGAAEWAMAGLVALALGAAAALLGFAMLRVLGVAFLGRPRGPRAAAAEEVAPRLRWAMLCFVLLLGLSGLLPGLLLRLAAPAVVKLAGASPPGGVLGVMGYAPLGLALLLALAAVAVALLVKAAGPAGHRVAAGWEGGAPPPAWLPFGDPATQVGAAGYASSLLRHLPSAGLGWQMGRFAGMARWLGAVPRRAAPVAALALLGAMLLLHGVGLW